MIKIKIAQALLFDRNNRLLIYLRDNKPEIPFPITGISSAATSR